LTSQERRAETKAAKFKARLRARGFDEAQLARLVSPIGLFRGGKHPAEVAVSALAQVLQHAASAAAAPANVHDRLHLPG